MRDFTNRDSKRHSLKDCYINETKSTLISIGGAEQEFDSRLAL